jgi:hypothetical protein
VNFTRAAAELNVADRVLLFCLASGTQWRRDGGCAEAHQWFAPAYSRHLYGCSVFAAIAYCRELFKWISAKLQGQGLNMPMSGRCLRLIG